MFPIAKYATSDGVGFINWHRRKLRNITILLEIAVTSGMDEFYEAC